MTLVLTNCDIYTGGDVLYKHSIVIDGERISSIRELDDHPRDAQVVDLAGASVSPGFIDLQVNGGGGVLLTDSPTVEAIETVLTAHRRFGTTGMLPTFITSDAHNFARARRAIDSCLERRVPGVLGVHFEGPFLNPEKAGVHDASLMRQPEEADLSWLRSRYSAATLVTVAPEVLPPKCLERFAAEPGVIVSAGHTAASYAQMVDAFSQGVSKVTHLYNAMSPLTSREPGVTGASLADRRSFCGIIVDGHHSHFAAVRVAWQAKELGRMFLVTDAMPPVGSSSSEFRIGPYEISVRDGRCTTADGVLAGSALDMATAVRNLIQSVGISKDEALRMATMYPAACLGRLDDLGRVAPGYRADLAIFDNEIYVSGVVVAGRYLCEEELA